MRMKQTARIISTYAADVSGVCSALFELGGMVVMHDASGCNSTYTTHDEPRWYSSESMIFISALTETEAIMGDDEKLVSDIEKTAASLSPRFIAIAGTPIPMMMGTDFKALASVIEKRTGLPCFGFPTNGMNTYVAGASAAFAAVAQRLIMPMEKTTRLSVNILGMTPLDFSASSTPDSIRKILLAAGIETVSCFAMGSLPDEIEKAASAHVNLVVSYSGMAAARIFEKRFGTPYVVGFPADGLADKIIADILSADKNGQSAVSFCGNIHASDALIIGDCVIAGSLAAASRNGARVICPLECEKSLLFGNSAAARDESELAPLLKNARVIIADPLYKPICPDSAQFIALPHEGFSGRIFRSSIPDLTKLRL